MPNSKKGLTPSQLKWDREIHREAPKVSVPKPKDPLPGQMDLFSGEILVPLNTMNEDEASLTADGKKKTPKKPKRPVKPGSKVKK